MSQQQPLTLAEAEAACEQAGVFLIELNHADFPGDGLFLWLDGKPVIVLREDLHEAGKVAVAGGILKHFLANGPQYQELKRRDEARLAARQQRLSR